MAYNWLDPNSSLTGGFKNMYFGGEEGQNALKTPFKPLEDRGKRITRSTQTNVSSVTNPLATDSSRFGSLEDRIEAALEAMRETQRRAKEDREAALSSITDREKLAIDEIRRTQGDAAAQKAALLLGIEKREMAALGGYAGAEELFRQGLAQPEAISPEIAAKMYERGRVRIEAGTQATQRRLQEGYASRGIPGGAMLGGMMGAAESGIGQKAALQRDIDIERATRKRQDLLSLLKAGSQLGGAKADIYGRTGQTLAGVYGTTLAGQRQLADAMANIYGQTGRTLSDIYGRTIAEVPKYKQGEQPTQPIRPIQPARPIRPKRPILPMGKSVGAFY